MPKSFRNSSACCNSACDVVPNPVPEPGLIDKEGSCVQGAWAGCFKSAGPEEWELQCDVSLSDPEVPATKHQLVLIVAEPAVGWLEGGSEVDLEAVVGHCTSTEKCQERLKGNPKEGSAR